MSIFKINKHLLILFGFLLASCSYHNGVFIKNNTKNNIEVNAHFKSKYGKNSLDFHLKPDKYDAWEYESGYFDRNTIDVNLDKITIKDESGCSKSLSRNELHQVTVKRGMWELTIDKTLLNCD